MRWPETVGNRLHIGNRRRRRAETKTAVTRRQHRRVVIFPHQTVGDENRIHRHRHGLYNQNRDHRQRQVRKLPEFQAHQRHRQE